MRGPFVRLPIVVLSAVLICVAPACGQNAATQQDSPAKIYADARNEFFTTINKFVAMHPRRSELRLPADVSKEITEVEKLVGSEGRTGPRGKQQQFCKCEGEFNGC